VNLQEQIFSLFIIRWNTASHFFLNLYPLSRNLLLLRCDFSKSSEIDFFLRSRRRKFYKKLKNIQTIMVSNITLNISLSQKYIIGGRSKKNVSYFKLTLRIIRIRVISSINLFFSLLLYFFFLYFFVPYTFLPFLHKDFPFPFPFLLFGRGVNVVLLIWFLLFLNSHVFLFSKKNTRNKKEKPQVKIPPAIHEKIKSTIIREWNERIRKSYFFLHSLK